MVSIVQYEILCSTDSRIGHICYFTVDDDCKFKTVCFLVGLVVVQLTMLVDRKPGEVISVATRGLKDCYYHLRPHPPLVSSLNAILDHVAHDLEE